MGKNKSYAYWQSPKHISKQTKKETLMSNLNVLGRVGARSGGGEFIIK